MTNMRSKASHLLQSLQLFTLKLIPDEMQLILFLMEIALIKFNHLIVIDEYTRHEDEAKFYVFTSIFVIHIKYWPFDL